MVSGMRIANGYLIDGVDFVQFVQKAMRITVEQEITGLLCLYIVFIWITL